MKKTPKAEGEKGKNIRIGRNSEIITNSNNVLSVKCLRAERDVFILNDSIFNGGPCQFPGHDSPHSTGINYLEQQMRALLMTLGYHCEDHEIKTECFFEWIINIPSRKKGYDRILLRGVEGEAELSDVVALSQAAKRQKTDEGWIVTARRISQAARSEATKKANDSLFCYTLDELLDEHADFSRYFDWLEDEVKKRGIDRKYVPVACIKEEFHPITKKRMGESYYDERNGWIDSYIDLWLDDPTNEHISILGESGSGKTWFALHYSWVALQRYLHAKERGLQRPRLPLYIPMRNFAKAVSLESFFLSSFCANIRFHCLGSPPLSNLIAWVNFC